jgi:hypothetical protein
MGERDAEGGARLAATSEAGGGGDEAGHEEAAGDRPLGDAMKKQLRGRPQRSSAALVYKALMRQERE